MNQQTQQPQNRAPGQGPPARGQPQLLRPEHMRTFGYLDAADKAKYEAGLKQLWAKVDSTPPDSPEHLSAKHKIAEFSRMVLEKMKKLYNMQQQQRQQQGQQSAGAQSQPLPAAPAPAPTNPAARPQSSAAAATATTSAPGPANTTPPKHIMDHVQKFPWNIVPVPPQYNTPEQASKFLQETKAQYARALITMETTKGTLRRIEGMINERQAKNPAVDNKDLAEQKAKIQKNYTDAASFVQKIRGQISGQSSGAQGTTAAQQPRGSQPMQPTNSGGVASTHPMQDATASVTAAMNAARAAHRGSVGGVPPIQQSQPQTQPASQQPQTPATPATPSTNAPGQAPQSVPVPNAQVKIEPGVNQQHPPPVHTALTAASSANLPSAGTPTHASARVQTPQSAQPPASATAQPRPLSHAAAVIRANSSSNIGQAGSASSGGLGNNNTNGPAPMVNNATPSAHTHAHPQPATTLTSKLPIPKVLPEKAQMPPVPVATGGGNTPGRPSYGGGSSAGGVQNQPVLPKIQVPQYDTEGEHVLSKKKLDELVRQVCGGGSPGADGNYLTPDVEESVLSVADNFVDNLISMACRLAKERGSKVLEIRDIQLVLERVYNIRIPGYTSDELRTVRKVQPAASWIQKMSAIQAAKVTSNKDDK
ncbi:hypothetical protein GGR57DRAFT_456688 [Xylariaceae sp. FL1272]|nr:hypothetical protein GGR57DRAFT_456688 [Xylariaceae sp. FL1272]